MLRVVLALALLITPALADEVADIRNVSQVADAFFSGYLKMIAKGGAGYEDTIKWVDRSAVPTKEYKSALTRLYRDALKADPESGYGADAVICGQDWPDRGFKVARVWLVGPMAFVKMVSRDPQVEHTIEARFIKADGTWHLDGTGPLSGGGMLAGREVLTDAQWSEKILGQWKDADQQIDVTKNGKWRDASGVGTWKIKSGVLLRSAADFKNEPFTLYVLDGSALIYTDGEGDAYRLTRVVGP